MIAPFPKQDRSGREAAHPREARVPGGTRLYAIGDIHGRADLLDALLGRIAQDAAEKDATERSAAENGISRRVMVFLGDYVDRGCCSRQVVERLTTLGETKDFETFREFDIHFLKGNHEDFLVEFIDSGDYADSWMINGGRETLESYGIDASAALTGEDPARLRRDFLAALPARHLEFLRRLELHHTEGDYFFVHAGVRADVPLDAQEPHDMMWIRRDFLSSQADFGKIIVHGHSTNPEPVITANRIGIDTAAYYSERLTGLVLEGGTRRFLHT